MGMLLGSLLGIQIGAMTTKVVKGITIRGFYAMAVLAGFVNRALALPAKLGDMDVIKISKGLASGLETLGVVNDERIADAAAIGFALPAAEGGVAGPCPTPGVMIKVIRSAQTIDCLQVIFR